MYMMGNPKNVVSAWRKRCYIFGSGTIFERICGRLRLYLAPVQPPNEIDVEERNRRIKALFRLKKDEHVWGMLGDAILQFIKEKPAPFPMITTSKKHMQSMPAYKRAMIAINVVRFASDVFANHHWHKYGYKNYKDNRRFFELYCKHDIEILSCSTFYQNLPETMNTSTPPRKTKKRTSSTFELSSPEMPHKKKKIICLLSSDSEEE